MSVARALIVVARRLPFEEENNAVVVVAGSGRGKKEESAGGGGAHPVPRRCRSPAFMRSRKGARLACVFGSTTCGCTWKCETGRNVFGYA